MNFDGEKLKEYYAGLIAAKDEAVAKALYDKDVKIAERLEEEKARIEDEVIKEIVAEAEAPYLHDIKLCEQFLVEEDEPEEPAKEVEAEEVEGE